MHFVMAVLIAATGLFGDGGGAQASHHSFCFYHPHAYVCVRHNGFHRFHRLHGGHHV
jgi:hypothetical protein